MLNLEVTNFPGGVGTASDESVFRSLPMPGPDVQWNREDFDSYGLSDTLLSQVPIGTGGGVASLDGGNGIRRITTNAADGSGLEFGFSGGGGQLDSVLFTVEIWYAIRFRVDDPIEFTMIAGHAPDGEGIAPANGVYLRTADGSADLEIVSERASAETALVLGTLEADTWYDAIYYWDNVDTVKAQFFGPGKRLAGAGSIIPGATLPIVGVEPVVSVAAGEAVSKIFDWDYTFFAAGRE